MGSPSRKHHSIQQGTTPDINPLRLVGRYTAKAESSQSVYVTMVMYGPTAFLTKVSILLILTRVFEPFKKAVIFIYVFMGLMLAYYIPAIIVKIRICMPISYFWMGDEIEGSCLDQNKIILADAVMSVVSDLILLVLPIPLGWQLQIPMGKKMRVIGILGAGGLACASSIVRLVMIVQEANTTDSTYSFMRINMWGYVVQLLFLIIALPFNPWLQVTDILFPPKETQK